METIHGSVETVAGSTRAVADASQAYGRLSSGQTNKKSNAYSFVPDRHIDIEFAWFSSAFQRFKLIGVSRPFPPFFLDSEPCLIGHSSLLPSRSA
jgi:hypothetical protein